MAAPAMTDEGIWNTQQQYAAALAGVGIRAVIDPRRIDPPCVLVVPVSADLDTMCRGDGTTRWAFWVLGGQPGGADTMRNLSRLTAKVLQAVEVSGTVDLTDYRADTGDAWPAFRIGFETVSSWI